MWNVCIFFCEVDRSSEGGKTYKHGKRGEITNFFFIYYISGSKNSLKKIVINAVTDPHWGT